MIALGFLFILVFFVAIGPAHAAVRLERARWFLWVLMGCIPLSLIAINMGWTAAEVGRQPWVVQGLMRTSDGVSPLVSAGQIWGTLGLFAPDLPGALHRLAADLPRHHQEGPEDPAGMLEAEKAGAEPLAPDTAGPAPAGAGR